jgi:hypothetical protein
MTTSFAAGIFAVVFGTFAFLIRKHSVRTSRGVRESARRMGVPLPSERFYDTTGALVGPLLVVLGLSLIVVGLVLRTT